MFKGIFVRKDRNEDTAVKEPRQDKNFEKAMTPNVKKLNQMTFEDQARTSLTVDPLKSTKTVAHQYVKRKLQSNKENEFPFYSQGTNQKVKNEPLVKPGGSEKKVFGIRKKIDAPKSPIIIINSSSPKAKKDPAKLFPEKKPQEVDFDLYLEREYGPIIEEDLLKNQPDFSKCLQNTNIKRGLRSKMVDWMGQVFKHYEKKFGFSKHVFFQSVAIMDMYFKHAKTVLSDSDLHLVGVTSIFLASKFHDYFHIPLKDLVDISQNELSADSIKAKEWEILQALNYTLKFDTWLTYLERIIYKNFGMGDDHGFLLEDLKTSTIKILEMCLHDNEFLDFEPNTLALAIVCYYIKSLTFGSEQDFETFKNTEEAKKERLVLKKILLSCDQIDIPKIEFCMFKINFIFQNLEKRHSEKTTPNEIEEDSQK